jgi:large conductance mechanosensitive channel
MLKEFKNFIITGNVVEFAVAIIMANAISEVVKGFVNNIVMPVVGYFTGGVDFADKKVILTKGIEGNEGFVEVTEVAISYGAWVNTIVNLIIVGFIMFLLIKAYNKIRKPAPAPAPTGPAQEDLLAEIRDLLKKQIP